MSGESVIEEEAGVVFVDGQRCSVWVRSEPDGDGTWHNQLLFRRTTRVNARDAFTTGIEWHLPPGLALQRARGLSETEQVSLFRRATQPRAPLA